MSCDVKYFILRENYRLRVVKDRVLKNIFFYLSGRNLQKGGGESGKNYITNSFVIKISSNIVKVINWEGPAKLTGDKNNAHRAVLGKREEK
jgi:hypothetical protein